MTIQRELPQLSDPQLLDKIDRLRDLNIAQHVALPQVGTSILSFIRPYSFWAQY